jgi:peroxiredoxin
MSAALTGPASAVQSLPATASAFQGPPVCPEQLHIKDRIKKQAERIKVGDFIPDVWLSRCTAPKVREHFLSHERFSKGTTVLVMVPEAFSPTCDDQLPDYVKYAIAIKSLGVETLAFMAINSPDVLRAWMIKHMKEHDTQKTILDVADVYGNFTIAAGLGHDFTGERAIGLGSRRCTLIIEPDATSGKPKVVHMILEPEVAPNQCVETSAKKVLEWLKANLEAKRKDSLETTAAAKNKSLAPASPTSTASLT